MTEAAWQICPPDLVDDDALTAAVIEVHRAILDEHLKGDPMLNLALGIQLRAFRQIEGWRVLLLLTPWMLVRLLFPETPPVPSLPEGWRAAERGDADYQVLGPRLDFRLLGQPQQAHLNYHPRFGHYLLQPICLNLEPYSDAEAVFEAWNAVIRTRDENLAKARRDCPLQEEVSRRELFTRFKP